MEESVYGREKCGLRGVVSVMTWKGEGQVRIVVDGEERPKRSRGKKGDQVPILSTKHIRDTKSENRRGRRRGKSNDLERTTTNLRQSNRMNRLGTKIDYFHPPLAIKGRKSTCASICLKRERKLCTGAEKSHVPEGLRTGGRVLLSRTNLPETS